MANAVMAKKILDMVQANPSSFDMGTFVGGLFRDSDPVSLPLDIEIQDVNVCQTTFCVAGWAVAFDGWTIPSAGMPTKAGALEFQGWEEEGKRILDITSDDALTLFYTSEERAILALEQLVDGAQEIDWDAIDEIVDDRYTDDYDGCPCCNGDSDYWDDDDPFEF